mgnify:CR=1 FL=1
MEQINSLNQWWQSSIKDYVLKPQFKEVNVTEAVNVKSDNNRISNVVGMKLLSKGIDWENGIIQSPIDFVDAFPEIIEKMYNQQVDAIKSSFKFLFDAIKFVAQKLGGWDKLIDLVMLAFPLPKHVKLVLEVLKKILPVISPLPKDSVPNFIFTALEKANETTTPEDLLFQIASSFATDDKQDIVKPENGGSIPLQSIIADGKMSLEDKVMYVLLSLANKEEKEILAKSKKLDDASSDSRQRLMIELQIQVQKLTQTYNALSNLMKTFHEASMNSIRNFR